MAVPHDTRATPYACADTGIVRQNHIYFSTSLPVSLHIIVSDLPTPAAALVTRSGLSQGFAQAGNRFPFPIGVENMLFGIML